MIQHLCSKSDRIIISLHCTSRHGRILLSAEEILYAKVGQHCEVLIALNSAIYSVTKFLWYLVFNSPDLQTHSWTKKYDKLSRFGEWNIPPISTGRRKNDPMTRMFVHPCISSSHLTAKMTPDRRGAMTPEGGRDSSGWRSDRDRLSVAVASPSVVDDDVPWSGQRYFFWPPNLFSPAEGWPLIIVRSPCTEELKSILISKTPFKFWPSKVFSPQIFHKFGYIFKQVLFCYVLMDGLQAGSARG